MEELARRVPQLSKARPLVLKTKMGLTKPALTHDGHYAVRVITRNTETPEAKALAALPNATLFKGQTYDEIDLQKAFEGVHMAYVNTNGFAIGEKAEIYWGIRSYEIARQHGLEHFVWANVPWGSKAGNYDPKYRCGHLDGKNKVTGTKVFSLR